MARTSIEILRGVAVISLLLFVGACAHIKTVDVVLGGNPLTGDLHGVIGLELRSEAEVKAYNVIAKAMGQFESDFKKCKETPDPVTCRKGALEEYEQVSGPMLKTLREIQQGTKNPDFDTGPLLQTLEATVDRYLRPSSR